MIGRLLCQYFAHHWLRKKNGDDQLMKKVYYRRMQLIMEFCLWRRSALEEVAKGGDLLLGRSLLSEEVF
jgi:hypothetical protein